MESGEASTSSASKKGARADWRRLIKDELHDLIQILTYRESEIGAPGPGTTPPNWLEEGIGTALLWSDETDYAHCKHCLSCMFMVPLLSHDYKDRDSADFKHKHLKEIITLTHINPSS